MFGLGGFELRAILIGAAVAALFALHKVDVYKAASKATADCQAGHAAEALKAEAANRAEEARRQGGAHEADLESQRLATLSRRGADRASAAAQRLLDAAAAARVSRPASDAAAAPASAPAAEVGDLYADMLREAVTEAREYAAEADDRGDRGASCEWRYDSLTPPSEGR